MTEQTGDATVVFVHGIWMTGLELSLLRYRVARCGYRTRLFRYRTTRRSPAENAEALAAFLARQEGSTLHLVAHSLGGIVVCHLLASHPPARLGRVLMLGSPLRGSLPARLLWRHRRLRWLLGRSGEQGLLDGAPPCPEGLEIGMIAGTRGFGVGTLLAGEALPRPHDGTVAVSETLEPAIRQRLLLPSGHFGMLFSRRVADAACRFLQSGRFD